MTDKQEIIEAEAVPTQAVAKREDIGLTTISALEQSFALAVRQRELLSDYIRKQLVPGKHFYQRGDQKPSLSKEGAEIILLPHNLAPDYELVSGPDQPPEGDQPYQITVKCILRRKGDPGSFVGSGMGSAGSQHRNRDGKYTPRQPDRFLCHNATLKMAQKSAMIAATINSTAASEFFTQDMDEAAEVTKATVAPAAPPQKPKKELKMPTAETRKWMIEKLEAGVGQPNRKLVTEYFQKVAQLLPNESVEDLPVRFVPFSKGELDALASCVANFEAGGDAVKAFEPHGEADDYVHTSTKTKGSANVSGLSRGVHAGMEKNPSPDAGTTNEKQRQDLRQGVPETGDSPRGTLQGMRSPGSKASSGLQQSSGGDMAMQDPPSGDSPEGEIEVWRQFPMPFGKHAGTPLEDLEKKYLYGLWANYSVETEYNGKPKKKETIAKDTKFREMLDLAGEHYEFTKKD